MKKIICIGLLFASCTDNQMARSFGGTEKIKIRKHEIILNVTWKEDNMWVCTKDTITNTVYFREKSSFGKLEGSVIFKP
jgi:hypothetical protein